MLEKYSLLEIWLQHLHLQPQIYGIDSNVSTSVHGNEGTGHPVTISEPLVGTEEYEMSQDTKEICRKKVNSLLAVIDNKSVFYFSFQ